ncbi:MAG: HDOD domain-containing protein [Aminobacterium sp.]|jgi:putative nucleotidyltransferase with HDIG domain|uniref:HDOD domain-containing protein n=1 Tax=unclassified Aminobacterium TaxID=2685012 RepID=UPI001BD0227C|nr:MULTISPECIES: HDOD domain-containing protein [unclassified Aminobacterium]MDD2205787.1 HDOD domain-containing protein [Aminobacterium sp.]MDD3706764.1 HDOD domain-containing protein [Aminobacterium sp.]MDD4229274.1 HDOD domain-containing protein [Aminobacterium sp.]MDD4550943.1 HDOD domain-containing protein [Aminobacterium sp.]MEA4876784.1 HDOD domain-containing protein [Aminobacterium sp.]
MNTMDDRSRELIKSRIINRVKEIKSFPQFVIETLRLLNDPESSAKDVARSLARDEGLVIRTLRLANSAAYGVSREISSVAEAIALLGYKNISNIVLAATVYSFMDKPLSGYALDRGELWRHSLTVAYASRYIAQRTGKVSLEEAYVAGLLHDIGKVVLNDYVRFGYSIIIKLVEEEKVPFLDAETQVLGFDHALVGALLVEKWELPEQYQYVAAFHHTPDRLPEEGEKFQPLVDTVHLANALCLMLGVGIGAEGLQNPLYPEVFERLGISDYELLLSEIVDFVSVATQELEEMGDL